MLSASLRNVNRKLKSTLVLFPGSLGDVICAFPALSALRRSGLAELVLATRGEAFDLCASFLLSERVISLEKSIFSQLFLDPQRVLISQDSSHFFSSFASIFSWYGHDRSEVQENLLRISPAEIKSFAFFSGQKECHVVSYYLGCVGEKTLCCPSLTFPEAVIPWQKEIGRRFQEKLSFPLLIIHPGSGGKRKRWDREGFRQVARWWRERKKGRVIVLLGPAEKSELPEWRSFADVESELSLLHLAALLSRADLYLGNDSGVSHLAGAIGACGVVLFGPTLPQKWRPLGGNLSVVYNLAYRTIFPDREGISLEEISVEEVVANLVLMGG